MGTHPIFESDFDCLTEEQKMKFKRKKNAKRYMQMYKNNFGFTEPYKILIDGTFAKHALDNKVQIFDQMKNYFGAEVVLYTTQCVLNELKEARGCLKDLIEKGNKDKLIFATKDANITHFASTLPGNPVVYLNGNTILLDRPSDATTDQINANAAGKLGLSEKEQAVLDRIRDEKRAAEAPKPKRKKPQNPNPLSCKKKKTNDVAEVAKVGSESTGEPKQRKRKKRVKVATHARDSVAAKMKILTESG